MSSIHMEPKQRLQFQMEYIRQSSLPGSAIPIYKKQKSIIMGENQQEGQVYGPGQRPKELQRQFSTQCSVLSTGNFSVIDIDSPTGEMPSQFIQMSQPPTKEKMSTFMKFSMYTVMLVCLIVLALMLGVFLWKMTAVEDPYAVYCTPCKELKLNSDPLYDYSKYFQRQPGADGEDICCPNSPETQKKMIEVMMKQTAMKEQSSEGHAAPLVYHNKTFYPPKPTFNHDAVYAHIESSHSNDEYSRGMYFVRDFNMEDHMAYKRSGIGYDKITGRFNISKQGTYLVQCQIAFQYRSESSEEEDSREFANRRFKFSIMRASRRYSKADDEVIVSHEEQAVCDVNIGAVCHTGIAEASPMLQAGDEVFLVSRYVDSIKTANFASSCSIINLD